MSRLSLVRRRGDEPATSEPTPGAALPSAGTGPTSASTASSPAAAAPARDGVDLLSDWVRVRLRVLALRRRFVIAVVALVVLVALVVTAQRFALVQARHELDGERAVGDGLQTRLEAMAPVAAYLAGVRLRAQVGTGLMAAQLDSEAIAKALDDALPRGAVLDGTTLTLGERTTPATLTDVPVDLAAGTRGLVTTCPGPDPFEVLDLVACVNVSGTAPNRVAVARMVEALDASPLFAEPFIDTTTTGSGGAGSDGGGKDDGAVTFTGSVGVTAATFTGRFDGLVDRLAGEPADAAATGSATGTATGADTGTDAGTDTGTDTGTDSGAGSTDGAQP
ncbi:hypothetical protein [Nocardioides sp. GY 10127]|uniref:hypothetical protein n=1 Tax=Nocardioides sp. GY 10127 TaxID=2569762 RepID=UPI0010A945FD|nr:hypothetical protein [Nocardioides sp. GY 10127]TIC78915.1 hypothetical protein E8D37_18740 [Nocardioides sp. GY 10127]